MPQWKIIGESHINAAPPDAAIVHADEAGPWSPSQRPE